MSLFVQRFICLSHNKFIFNVSRHINNFRRNHTIFFVDFSKWGFNKTIFINSCKSCQIRNQTNVRTFWCFNWTHTSVMAIMNVTNFETGSVTRKSARTQCRKAPFVCKFSKRISLIHKL